MANRYFTAVVQSMEKLPVSLYIKVSFGATGAPTLVAGSAKGAYSITRNSAGLYTLVFGTSASSLDTYYRLLALDCVFNTVNTSAAPAAPLYYIAANNVAVKGTASLQIQFTNVSQAATDPANGEILHMGIVLSNSSAY